MIMRSNRTILSLFYMGLLAMSSTATAQTCNDMQFTDVTLSAGINHLYARPPTASPSTPGGATVADVNGDGWMDIYAVQGDAGASFLYINDQNGGFTEEAATRGAELVGHYGTAASAADFDNDGDIDLGVSVYYGNSRVLINNGSGNFTAEIVLPFPVDQRTFSSSWGDVDNDGLLELAIGMWVGRNGTHNVQGLHLYKNNSGTLQDYEFRTSPQIDSHIFAPRFADLNGDRLSDLHVIADYGESKLFMNVGGGMFDPSAGAGGENDMGHTIGDYDKDGDLDIFTTDITTNNGNTLWNNNGQASFTNVSASAGIADGGWAWGGSFGDLDNDADLDIYHVNGFLGDGGIWQDDPGRLFMNNDDGTFDEVAACAGAEAAIGSMGRGVSLFDYDNDGDLDIFIVNNRYSPLSGGAGDGRPVLLRNDTPANGRHWLQVTLDGTPPMHRDGIGSRVYVQTGGTTQLHEMHASTNYVSQDAGHIAHFGLNSATVADEVRAEWVTGDATVFTNVNGDQRISVPSPTATLSTRTPVIGQNVTATSNESDPVEWKVGGNTFADPVTTSFSTGGTQEMTLLVYNSAMTQVVRTELIRIDVDGAAGEPDITSPANGSTLAIGDVSFAWNDNGANVDDWQLLVGTSVGDNSLHDSGVLPVTTTGAVVSGLPEDGSTIHVTLRWTDGGNASDKNYTYVAATGVPADTTAPLITLVGSAAVTLTVGDAYVDEGATATDDVDGDITANIVTVNPVNTGTAGTYTVTYNVSDAAGNAATEVTRTVIVDVPVVPDTTAPVITLIGGAVTLTVGDAYIDEGATATDDVDGDITAKIVTVNPVDTGTAGTYTVTYNVSDDAGNAATEVTRTVIVDVPVVPDTTAPVITLIGGAVTLTVGDAHNDEGATATDDVDGDITAKIVTVNPVDTGTAGTYTVTYNVSDAAGNAATEVTRTVTVNSPPPVSPPPPTRTSSGGGSISLPVMLLLAGLALWHRRKPIPN